MKKQVQEDYHIYRELEEEKKKGSMDEAEKNKRMDFRSIRLRKQRCEAGRWRGCPVGTAVQEGGQCKGNPANMQTTSMH